MKRELFERAGALAYWIVDPSGRPAEARLIAWELTTTGGYRQVADVTGKEPFQALVPFPVTVVPAEMVR